ncbi:MAG TPA: hypothetical protein VFC97_07755 [Verrucomicrobiae bacterium]|nr:hypothetical protein [Verrucomicrobiae bacterium]
MTKDVTPTPALDDDLLDPASAIPPASSTPPRVGAPTAAGIQSESGTRPPGERRTSADLTPRRPAYKGEELDPARGPGLGCFWFQAAVLAVFLVLIPVGVSLNWPFELLAALLFVALGLLLFVGQTLIFLLRLVAADRRDAGRRRPLASPTPTVGQLEDALLDAPVVADAAAADPTVNGDAERAEDSPNAAAKGATLETPDGTPPAVEPGSDGVRE